MNFFVIGTDHRIQNSEPGFAALLRALLEQRYFEPLTAIAEEYHDNLQGSTARRLAEELNLRWYNVDMSTEEKHNTGILAEQRSRPGMFQEAVTFRLPSDDVREEAWVKKLTEGQSGTTLVICGYLHFEALVQKLRAGGHIVDKRVYLETVPTIESAPERRSDSAAQ